MPDHLINLMMDSCSSQDELSGQVAPQAVARWVAIRPLCGLRKPALIIIVALLGLLPC